MSDEDQPAITHVWWPRFVDTITFLFSKGHCWKVQGTYSALMLCLAQIDPNWFVELQSHRHTPKLLVQSIRNVLLRLSLKVDWRYHQVSSNRNTLIRRRLKAQPLTIKIVRPGGTVGLQEVGWSWRCSPECRWHNNGTVPCLFADVIFHPNINIATHSMHAIWLWQNGPVVRKCKFIITKIMPSSQVAQLGWAGESGHKGWDPWLGNTGNTEYLLLWHGGK